MPEAQLANSHSVGFTDSNWFRAAFPDTVAYNFAPHLVEGYDEVTPRYHNVDERILVRDLAFQALFAERVALELLSVSMKPYMLAVIGATLDLMVAAMLWVVGMTWFGVFMGVVAVVGYVLAVVLWRRTR